MSIVEVETWLIAPGNEEQHHEIIRRWAAFVQDHRELFEGWRSVRYYRQVAAPDGEPTGRYVMLFEYESMEARNAYKERRKDFQGPYAEYKKVDPYQFFDHSSVTVEHWEPQEEGIWFSFDEAEARSLT
jgi:hypothetical protein